MCLKKNSLNKNKKQTDQTSFQMILLYKSEDLGGAGGGGQIVLVSAIRPGQKIHGS